MKISYLSSVIVTILLLLSFTSLIPALNFTTSQVLQSAPWGPRSNFLLTTVASPLSFLNFTAQQAIQNNYPIYPPSSLWSNTSGQALFMWGSDQGENDVWVSNDNGLHWDLFAGTATNCSSCSSTRTISAALGGWVGSGFIAVQGQMYTHDYQSTPNGPRFYAFGGENDRQVLNPLANWVGGAGSDTEIAPWTSVGWFNPSGYSPRFQSRSFASVATSRANDVFITNGIIQYSSTALLDRRTMTNDVWVSPASFGPATGLQWTRRAIAPWTPRAYSALLAYDAMAFNNSNVLTMIGGCSISSETGEEIAERDVYVSRDNGFTWLLITGAVPFVERCEFASTVTSTGILVISGGRLPNTGDVYGPIVTYPVVTALNDLWASLDGGYNWLLLSENLSYSARYAFAMTIDASGFLLVAGGRSTNRTNDIWRSELSLTDITQWGPLLVSLNTSFVFPSVGCIGLSFWNGSRSELEACIPVSSSSSTGGNGFPTAGESSSNDIPTQSSSSGNNSSMSSSSSSFDIPVQSSSVEPPILSSSSSLDLPIFSSSSAEFPPPSSSAEPPILSSSSSLDIPIQSSSAELPMSSSSAELPISSSSSEIAMSSSSSGELSLPSSSSTELPISSSSSEIPIQISSSEPSLSSSSSGGMLISSSSSELSIQSSSSEIPIQSSSSTELPMSSSGSETPMQSSSSTELPIQSSSSELPTQSSSSSEFPIQSSSSEPAMLSSSTETPMPSSSSELPIQSSSSAELPNQSSSSGEISIQSSSSELPNKPSSSSELPIQSSSAGLPGQSSSSEILIQPSSSSSAFESQSSSTAEFVTSGSSIPTIVSSSSTADLNTESSSTNVPGLSSSTGGTIEVSSSTSNDLPSESSSGSSVPVIMESSSSSILAEKKYGCSYPDPSNTAPPSNSLLVPIRVQKEAVEALDETFGSTFMGAIATTLGLENPPVINCYRVSAFTPPSPPASASLRNVGINSVRISPLLSKFTSGRKLLQADEEMSVWTIILGNLSDAYPSRQPSDVFTALNDSVVDLDSQLYVLAPYVVQNQTIESPQVICGDGRQIPFGNNCDDGSGGDDDLSSGQLAGIIVGSVIGGILLLLCCVGIICFSTRQQKTQSATQSSRTTAVPASVVAASPKHGAQPYPLHPDIIHNQIGQGAATQDNFSTDATHPDVSEPTSMSEPHNVASEPTSIHNDPVDQTDKVYV